MLRVGLWLGTMNRITKMEQFKYGWRLTDETGSRYRQPDWPDGMQATDYIEREPAKRPKVPWPVRIGD